MARADSRGLSPRVRGSLAALRPAERIDGSIPACAGEPVCRYWANSASRVYPRVCGGAPYLANHGAFQRGSIPACAGEPLPQIAARSRVRVYPRVCGGAFLRRRSLEMPEGLSPRVRGSQARPSSERAGQGSIPACAGEPSRKRSGQRMRWVYPRVCGGARRMALEARLKSGLSPRVRGSRASESGGEDFSGSIPACAGEPTGGRRRPLV